MRKPRGGCSGVSPGHLPHKREHVTIGQNDEPVLRKIVARQIPASAIALQEKLNARLPTRNVLDILANIEHWTHFTRHFEPLSGIDPQIRKAAERYLLRFSRWVAIWVRSRPHAISIPM